MRNDVHRISVTECIEGCLRSPGTLAGIQELVSALRRSNRLIQFDVFVGFEWKRINFGSIHEIAWPVNVARKTRYPNGIYARVALYFSWFCSLEVCARKVLSLEWHFQKRSLKESESLNYYHALPFRKYALLPRQPFGLFFAPCTYFKLQVCIGE